MNPSAEPSAIPTALKLRRYASSIMAGLLISSFTTHALLFCSYIATCPASPDPIHALTYEISNHGTHRYMNKAEATGMRLSYMPVLPLVLSLIIVIPKVGVVRKKMGSKKGFDVIGRFEPSRKEVVSLWITAAAYIGAAFLVGPSVVAWALRSGFPAP